MEHIVKEDSCRYLIMRAKVTPQQLLLRKKYQDRIVVKLNNRKHSCRKRVQFELFFRQITLQIKLITVLIQELNRKLKFTYDMASIRNSIQIEEDC